jgi:hypothetical protein
MFVLSSFALTHPDIYREKQKVKADNKFLEIYAGFFPRVPSRLVPVFTGTKTRGTLSRGHRYTSPLDFIRNLL